MGAAMRKRRRYADKIVAGGDDEGIEVPPPYVDEVAELRDAVAELRDAMAEQTETMSKVIMLVANLEEDNVKLERARATWMSEERFYRETNSDYAGRLVEKEARLGAATREITRLRKTIHADITMIKALSENNMELRRKLVREEGMSEEEVEAKAMLKEDYTA